MSTDSADRLLSLRVSPEAQRRVDELGKKSNAGNLTKQEREEYEELIRIGTHIATLQAQARSFIPDSSYEENTP